MRYFYMVTPRLHKWTNSILALVFTGFLVIFSAEGTAGPADTTDISIQHLLDYVARSDLTFIRNATEYSASEASEHMRKKYAHFRDEITSAERFIELCATRSILTGIPYKVITEQGAEVRTDEWLKAELKEYRNSLAAKAY